MIPTAWAERLESGPLGAQVKRTGTRSSAWPRGLTAVWPQRRSGAGGCVRRHTGGAGDSVSLRQQPEGVLVRWMTAGLCVLSLVGTLGCPHAFGRGGTIDRAMLKDLKERLKDGRCTENDIRRYCAEGMDLEDCLDQCE